MQTIQIQFQPLLILLTFAGLVIFRWLDVFMKSAASEAGKPFGQRFGDAYARKAATRFGVTGITGMIVLGVVTVGLFAAGATLAFAVPDCESQKSGYTLMSGTLGMWS
jgi:hypothetical protein